MPAEMTTPVLVCPVADGLAGAVALLALDAEARRGDAGVGHEVLDRRRSRHAPTDARCPALGAIDAAGFGTVRGARDGAAHHVAALAGVALVEEARSGLLRSDIHSPPCAGSHTRPSTMFQGITVGSLAPLKKRYSVAELPTSLESPRVIQSRAVRLYDAAGVVHALAFAGHRRDVAPRTLEGCPAFGDVRQDAFDCAKRPWRARLTRAEDARPPWRARAHFF